MYVFCMYGYIAEQYLGQYLFAQQQQFWSDTMDLNQAVKMRQKCSDLFEMI